MARPNPVHNVEVEQATGTRAGAAAYVAAMTADLAAIVRRHNLETLGYLLDMAPQTQNPTYVHDAALGMSQSYTDSHTGITITPAFAFGSTAWVYVSFP